MENQAFEGKERLPVSSNPDNKKKPYNPANFGLLAWRELLETFIGKHQKLVNYGIIGLLVVLYHAYFVYCIYR